MSYRPITLGTRVIPRSQTCKHIGSLSTGQCVHGTVIDFEADADTGALIRVVLELDGGGRVSYMPRQIELEDSAPPATGAAAS